MLQFLRNTLLGSERDDPSPSEHLVTDKQQITSLLLDACSHHVLFNVRFTGLESTFSTALIGIYDEHDFIVLDELTPEEGNGLLKIKRQITLSGRLSGVLLKMSTRLIEAREKNGIAYYKVSLPENVQYRQQRKSPRIPIKGTGIPFHALRGKGNRQILRGYVNNLSRKGVGLVLIEEEITLYRGEVLPSCIITIPDVGEVTFSLEVSFSRHDQHASITHIGGRFRDIGGGDNPD